MKRYTSLIAASLMLAVLAPLQTRAADNTWNNGSANFLWDLTSANWTSPTIWADGANALFGATGVGTVTLGSAITVDSQTFNTAGYTIAGGSYALTLVGTTPTITVNASATNAASLNGTNGLTVQGSGVLTLQGDAANFLGNTYTGGTYVRGGTLVLDAPLANASGTSYAVDSIEALDAGATVKFNAPFNGSIFDTVRDQIASHSTAFASRLNLTGGTFDLNDDPKKQHIPVPEGTGLIINTGTNVQAGLIMVANGSNRVFSGVIADGGPLLGDNIAPSQGPGRQIGIVSFAASINGGGGTLTLSGSNTYSGSTRIDQGATIKLAGNGTIGFPTEKFSFTGPMRVYGPGGLDLNGHNQTIALMTSGNAAAKIYNSAVGTVSTLTFGYGNEQSFGRNAGMQFIDNLGTGGILAMKKVATGPPFITPGTLIPATNCIQTLSGVNTYSGDTTVEGGHLNMATATAVSANSAFRLFTVAQGTCPDSSVSLILSYSGDANVRQLWIDGVQQPNGTYGAGTPGINPGSIGTITVTGSTVPNTWKNTTANFLWDLTSANWTSPTIWADGANALFGATGVGTVTLGSAITVDSQTFNTAGYTIAGGSYALTLVGTTPTITVNASATNAASLNGTNGLTVQGSGVLTLQGDAANFLGNTYTGGTYVRGGTLVLDAPLANASGTSYAVDSIEALDAGATVKFNAPFNGSIFDTVRDQIASHSTAFASRLNLTGGTFDLNDDPKKQHIPVPEGTGLIINTGTNVQAGLIMVANGSNRVFSGVIADGGPLLGDNIAPSQGPGRQIGIVSFAASINGGGGTLTLSGSNTYSGSTRIDQGATIKLAGNGTIGFPTEKFSFTGPMRVYGPGGLDLNGHNQTIALMTSGNAAAKIYNSAVGTVSTLTFGYGNEQSFGRNAGMQFIDNLGTGGILAMKKVATGPPFITPGTLIPATNCIQTLSGVNTYSGDTTVEGGHLNMATATAVSANSAFRLFTVAQGTCPDSSVSLILSYSGDANVRQLWIDGVQQPNGTYGAGTPGINPGSIGTITVTGYAPVTLSASQSGSTLNFSWLGVYKLQSKTNNIIGPWFDYPGGGTSPLGVPINAANGSVYFRLSPF